MQKAIEDLKKLNLIDQDILDWAFAEADTPINRGGASGAGGHPPKYKNWEILTDPVRDIINLQKLRNYASRQHSFRGR